MAIPVSMLRTPVRTLQARSLISKLCLDNAWTRNAPKDCYIFTATSGFYSAKAACGTKGAYTSYYGPWGLCIDYLADLCLDAALCSSEYVSVLSW